ncbi:MAG TPA: hypothetical protein PLJ38_04965, partial [bacterium]|nr:hypothetical protein [bacterium]
IIQNFAIESFYDLSALPIGRDISFTIKARNSANELVTGFSGSVMVEIQENGGMIFNSWTSNKFETNKGSKGFTVKIVDGIGYFTLNNSDR